MKEAMKRGLRMNTNVIDDAANIEINKLSLTSKNGTIKLYPNCWSHVYWWREDENIEEFMRNNKQVIIDYSQINNLSLNDSVDILYQHHTKDDKRISKTQLMATPTLRGDDARNLIESLTDQQTEESKLNGQKLIEYFKEFESK